MVRLLVLLLLVCAGCSSPDNARCPLCGVRFRVDGLDDMVEFRRRTKFHKCPQCGTSVLLDSLRRCYRER